jgi:hypothetical protein
VLLHRLDGGGDGVEGVVAGVEVHHVRALVRLHRLVTALDADLQLVAFVPLQRRPELPLQQRQHHQVHRTSVVVAVAGGGHLDEHELGLQRDVAAGDAHPLRHPPQLEPEAAHEPQVPTAEAHARMVPQLLITSAR